MPAVDAPTVSQPERPDVRPGQVWKDWDKRYRNRQPGRLLEVVSTDATHATCRVQSSGRRVRIKLTRFVPDNTGYKLITDAP